MIRIIIADDHELIREGVKKIIRSSNDMRVAGEAADTGGMLELASRLRPDIAILDIGLPGQDGLEGLEEARRRFPDMPVLILSMHPEERFAIRALKSGAAGYITKSMAAEELIKAIRKVMSGGSYISPRLAELLALDVREPRHAALHDGLTARELQVARMIAAGKQIKQIAAELEISISSVNTYRNRIFGKMGLSSNASLIRYAVTHGLVE